ncbi:MAG: SGNH/GDSL hydrolase family protein [Saprospiraceae bacterium]|nr:SGNH/GDSL hydrolase family protein [Saprospiraceae bacterium]
MYGYGFGLNNFNFDTGGTPTPPVPADGSFVDLSWSGNTSAFDFGIANTIANNFNSIKRNSTSTSFVDRTIYSDQSTAQDQAFTWSGNLKGTTRGVWFSIGQTGLHHAGFTFTDLEFALRCDAVGATVNWEWWESGVKQADIGTTATSDLSCWSIEYDGANGISVSVDNGALTYSATSSYTTENIGLYILGRDANGSVIDQMAQKTILQPNRILLAFGDSITFGGADVGGYSTANGSSYVAKVIAYENHRHFALPVLADPGDASGQMLSGQIPRASDYYDVTYDSNLATMMIGINDLRVSVPLATIQANISSAVSTLQTDGFTVVICTVIRDHSAADYPDRATLNTWINAGSSGADFVCDLTGTDLETDTALFEADLLHPNPSGMTVIANNLWLITRNL